MLRIALFLALVAGASASSDYSGKATCALLLTDAYCRSVTYAAAATGKAPSDYCSCSNENKAQFGAGRCLDNTTYPAQSKGCFFSRFSNACSFADDGLQLNMDSWVTTEQAKCTAENSTGDGLTETDCKGTTGPCTWSKPAGNADGTCLAYTDSYVATATGKGATAVQLAHLKLFMHDYDTCGPLGTDAATCNANKNCVYNTNTSTCVTGIYYLVSALDSGGCTTEAAELSKLHNFDVATANAIAAPVSGAASFSSLAVVVSALVAALSLIA